MCGKSQDLGNHTATIIKDSYCPPRCFPLTVISSINAFTPEYYSDLNIVTRETTCRQRLMKPSNIDNVLSGLLVLHQYSG